jgi:hypothetical protein
MVPACILQLQFFVWGEFNAFIINIYIASTLYSLRENLELQGPSSQSEVVKFWTRSL